MWAVGMSHSVRSASRTYWREISVLLAAKVMALALLYVLFFAAPQSVPPIADHLFRQGARR